MPVALRLVFLAFITAFWGCGGKGESGDADTSDPPTEDAAADDLEDGPEADGPLDIPDEEGELPSPEELYCHACVWDSDCGPGGECALLDDEKLSCLTACTGDDCPSGSACTARSDGVLRCVPSTNTCVWDELGGDCPSWGCSGREGLCSDPAGSAGYCTHECTNRADCEAGYNRCEDRGDGVLVCLRDLPSPFERCGHTEHDDGVGSPCGSSTCSDTVFLCTDTVETSLPAFCTRICSSDTECGAHARCVVLQGTDGSTRYCIPDECSCLGVVPGSMLDTGLEAMGMTRCDLSWPEEIVSPSTATIRNDRFRLSWFDDLHNDWLRGGAPFAEEIEPRLDTAQASGYGDMIVVAAEYACQPIAGGAVSYTPDASDPLAMAVATIMETLGETAELEAYRTDAEDIPADLQRAAAMVLLAAADAIEARERVLAPTIGGDETEVGTYFMYTPSFILPIVGGGLTATNLRTQALLIDDYGYEEIYQAGYRVARAVEQAGFDSLAPSGTFSFDQDTPAGRIIISGTGDDTYDGSLADDEILLLVDAGGSDTYRVSAGANHNTTNPVSVAIDLDGSDLYAYAEEPDPRDGSRLVSDDAGRRSSSTPISLSNHARQGAGRMGVGMLFDLGGDDDTYRSLRMSQGFGVLGVGLLWDDGGNDDYLCEAGCQGSGIWGLGILVDAGGGQDEFSAYHVSQGFGYVGAVGILYNEDGPDSYLCNQGDVLFPSAQHDESNASFCQGAAFGRRADTSMGGDGVFMSGGLGVLRDLGGDDTYEAAVFAQGAGYWFGMGALLEGGGDDVYTSRWYVLGIGAHYANGLVHDASGNDNFNEFEDTRMFHTLGMGHDYSNGFFIDDAGNDTYHSPGISNGIGNKTGFGLFLDRAGTDSHVCATNYSFGNALTHPTRTTPPSVGIFLEAEGTDTYSRPDTTRPANDSLWLQRLTGASNEHGVGVDVDTAGVPGI